MKISQREARRLKKRVRVLEGILQGQRARWSGDWPGGVEIASFQDTGELVSAEIRTARALHHAVVATVDGNNGVRLYGLPLRETPL